LDCAGYAALKGNGFVPRLGNIGPHSQLEQLDGRSSEAKMLKQFRAELTEAVGGHPNKLQETMIGRSAQLMLRLYLLDQKIAESGNGLLSEATSKYYLAWSNSLERSLTRLAAMGGKQAKKPPITSMAELHAMAKAGLDA
jgi:hypothetical protein